MSRTWAEICADPRPGDDAHAAALPDAARTLPPAWQAELLAGRRLPAARLVRALRLHAAMPHAALLRLLRAPELASLRILELRDMALSASDVRAIASVSALQSVRTLHVDGSSLGMHGGSAIIGSDFLGRVRDLSLRRCGLTDAFVEVLASRVRAAELRALALDGNALTDRAAVALALSAHTAQLQRLSLADNAITADGARRLAASPHLRRLSLLDLSGCPIGKKGREAIYWSTTLSHEARAPYRG